VDQLAAAAAKIGAFVAIGVSELDGGTLYNTPAVLRPGR
jgi:hypothetical protein